MTVKYGKKIRTIMKGKYSELERELPLLCKAVKYEKDFNYHPNCDRADVEISPPKYSIELVQEDDKYLVVFVVTTVLYEEVGIGDHGSIYKFTFEESCHHNIDNSFIEDDNKILENIVDDKWTDFIEGDIYFSY